MMMGKVFRYLRDLELLEPRGQGSTTYYLPGKILKDSWVIAPQGSELETEEHLVEGKKHQVEDEKHRVEGKKHRVEAKSEAPPLPRDLEEALQKLTKRTPQDQIRAIIKRLCTWQEMTSAELAGYLNREKKGLVRVYLTPMIKDGLLIYKYPAMPDHPNQTYRNPNPIE